MSLMTSFHQIQQRRPFFEAIFYRNHIKLCIELSFLVFTDADEKLTITIDIFDIELLNDIVFWI